MGIFSDGDREPVDDAVRHWKQNCLLADGSLLFEDEQIWTKNNIAALHQAFNKSQIEGKGVFEEKFTKQLANQERAVVRLAAECVVVYLLFVGWLMNAEGKKGLVRRVLLMGREPEESDEAVEQSLGMRGLEGSIGNPGAGYNYRRPYELMFVIDFARAWKDLEPGRQREMLEENPAELQSWIDDLAGGASYQFRHIALHLLWPSHYERIASGGHKRRVSQVFGGLIEDQALPDDDARLTAIRTKLREVLPDDSPLRADEEFDFYRVPLIGAWFAAPPEDQQALEYKGQLVYHGPPGTSKTYEARKLAEALIRARALDPQRGWGAARYFREEERLAEIVKRNVHYLQLHPAYSYEDFIGGLRLDGQGATVYERGFLPKLVDAIEADEQEAGDDALPHVLILDEMNRADLSQVLGEAFSRLERSERDKEVGLTGIDPTTGKHATLKLPSSLFVVGTMNLIDQSVEQVDFALRRRFLWRESRFDEQRLREVLQELWGESRRIPWEKVAGDMDRLARAAGQLNGEIAEVPTLGSQYEIGHTYFFDAVELLDARITGSGQRTFLWGSGGPRETLEDLWNLALKPLLEEYLAGTDARSRSDTIDRLRRVFYETS